VEGLSDDLPAFVNEPPQKLRSWAPLTRLSPEAKALVDATAGLKKGGLIEGHIVWTWVARRILSLQARALPLSQYIGPRDPARVSQEELNPKETDAYIGFLVGPDTVMKS
jgi:hypothetical protein